MELGEDELILVFRNTLITAKDLLNFRFVNRQWLAAATSCLIQRNACELRLNVVRVPLPSTETLDAYTHIFCNSYNKKQLSTINDLNDVISKSPKFPCTKLRLGTTQFFDKSYFDPDRVDSSDLIKLFSLLGEHLKSFCPGTWISKIVLQHIVLTYTPNLINLDLSCKSIGKRQYPPQSDVSNVDEEQAEDLNCLPHSCSPLNLQFAIKSLTLIPGMNTHFLRQLLRSSKHLQAIEDVNTSDLKVIVDEGKVHCVKSLTYSPSHSDVSMLQNVVEMKPKLRYLNINFDSKGGRLAAKCPQLIRALNTLIESCRSSLMDLKFGLIYPINFSLVKLRIPPLPNLKTIAFYEKTQTIDEEAGAEQDNQNFQNEYFHGFQSFIEYFTFNSVGCYPNLCSVKLVKDRFAVNGYLTTALRGWCWQSYDEYDESGYIYCFPTDTTMQIYSLDMPLIHVAQSIDPLPTRA